MHISIGKGNLIVVVISSSNLAYDISMILIVSFITLQLTGTPSSSISATFVDDSVAADELEMDGALEFLSSVIVSGVEIGVE
ncbi:hypothetical protein HN51_020891 [Arachis hypogaea]